MKQFWLCFIPLFIAVDAIGVLPIFLGLTQDMERRTIRHIIYQSVVTASVVALLFLAVGVAVLAILGITVADFMVAGGILLFIISMSDLLTSKKVQRSVDPEGLGAVPLGVPLITGPAVLSTSILLVNEYGFYLTALSIVLNILIAGTAFIFAQLLNRFLGKAGAKALSKVANLLLAAIGVMMVRRGIALLIGWKL